MLFQLHYYVVALLVSLIEASIVKGIAIESTRMLWLSQTCKFEVKTYVRDSSEKNYIFCKNAAFYF